MSLASWKREFYKTPANKVSKRFALEHSLRKWTGLLRKNRRKHKVYLIYGVLWDKRDAFLKIGGPSCALCKYYRHLTIPGCTYCPLFGIGSVENDCLNEFRAMLNNNKVTPMVNLLRKALERN